MLQYATMVTHTHTTRPHRDGTDGFGGLFTQNEGIMGGAVAFSNAYPRHSIMRVPVTYFRSLTADPKAGEASWDPTTPTGQL